MEEIERRPKMKTSRYIELVESFPPRPIRSVRELERTQKVVDVLIDKGENSKDERDYLTVLGTLIEAFEEKHVQIPDVTDKDMLTYLIETKSMTQRAVAEGTGIPESSISDLLAGRREFNRGHIERLASYFKVSPAVFFKVRKEVPA